MYIYVDANNANEMETLHDLLEAYPDAKVWSSPTGRPEFEPGSLSGNQLRGLLIDVLADLWRDSYRRENPTFQRKEFCETLHDSIYCATGETISVGGR